MVSGKSCKLRLGGFELRDTISWVYGCLSEDTEILTINGWQKYSKTIDKNPVLCYKYAVSLFSYKNFPSGISKVNLSVSTL